jgi:hypothetical protein
MFALTCKHPQRRLAHDEPMICISSLSRWSRLTPGPLHDMMHTNMNCSDMRATSSFEMSSICVWLDADTVWSFDRNFNPFSNELGAVDFQAAPSSRPSASQRRTKPPSALDSPKRNQIARNRLRPWRGATLFDGARQWLQSVADVSGRL